MGIIRTILTTEPALVTGAVAAVLAALATYGLPITPDQSKATVAAVTAVIILGAAIVTRAQVSSPATVERITRTLRAGPTPPAE